ncbi:FHA domain-containing protein [Microlunatus ginsengisoli]|uniref:FHA domain-containing protein n=1 Tax=Microlunatus ginsengisoli TaxID=363863 RepID=A0ABP7A0D0_9ACTN
MSAVCPNGHSSTAEDYCDVCGAPIEASGQGAAAPSAPSAPAPVTAASGGPQPCPHCGTENVAEALFCEACGYDFTTGTLPRGEESGAATAGGTDQPDVAAEAAEQTAATPTAEAGPDGSPAPAAAGDFAFVAEVWIDPAWYEAQQSPDPLPSPGLPEVIPLRKPSLLIGRVSRSRNIHPDIDCEPDSGASRRQAQLTTDGTRWWVEDLESANGTFVAGGSDPLPENPIPVGLKQEIQPGMRIYVGAWTRIVVRPATSEEQESLV